MNDVQLFAGLKTLGIPEQKAWALTQKIRDRYHPIAAVAAMKAHGVGLGAENQATKSVSLTLVGAKAGATVGSVIPVVGTAVGAVVGAVVGLVGSFFGPAKEGQSALTWDDMQKNGYLAKEQGRAFDERYFGEAMKGAMDENGNQWPCCGANGHKVPDTFYQPLAQQIVNGYLNKVVALNATPAQVMSAVVMPWLQGGASGLMKYSASGSRGMLTGATTQALIGAAVDRYLAGLPITRADMPSYAGMGYTQHQPALNVALASLLNPAPAATNVSATLPAGTTTTIPPQIVAAATPVAAVITPAATPVDTTAAVLTTAISGDGVNLVSPPAQALVADVAANGVQQTPYGPPTLGSELLVPGLIAGAALILYLVLKK